MDPLTHIWLTRRVVGTNPTIVLAGMMADAPFYLTYPVWVVKQGQLKQALQTHEWHRPPAEKGHHAFHSLPLLGLAALLVRWRNGRFPRRFFYAWALHILVDLPTHSRRQWAPQFLWPFSSITMDGVSWIDWLMRALHGARGQQNRSK